MLYSVNCDEREKFVEICDPADSFPKVLESGRERSIELGEAFLIWLNLWHYLRAHSVLNLNEDLVEQLIALIREQLSFRLLETSLEELNIFLEILNGHNDDLMSSNNEDMRVLTDSIVVNLHSTYPLKYLNLSCLFDHLLCQLCVGLFVLHVGGLNGSLKLLDPPELLSVLFDKRILIDYGCGSADNELALSGF